ncbi:MAG TPA: hypothetical protein VF774_07065 [Pseudoduganella sp.]|jgi:hypothetical protein
MTACPRSRYRRATPRGRVASWALALSLALAAIVLLLQLFAAAAHHDHELAAKSQHCVACALHAQPHGAPPDAQPPPPALHWTLLQILSAIPFIAAAAHAASCVLPPAQAPPPFLSLR